MPITARMIANDSLKPAWPGRALVATLAAFARVHRGAAALLAPYLAWVTFAAFLNFTLGRLNS